MINKKLSYVVLTALVLTGCSNASLEGKLPDNRPSYKTSTVTNPLEIPPDLTQSSMDDVLAVPEFSGADKANLSTYQNERSVTSQQSLATSLKNIHRSGDATWVEINARPDVVFDHAKSFWVRSGLRLARVDKNIGIMETDWLEAQGNMPKTGIARLISTVVSPLTDSDMRDKFRTRIDYDGNKTFVYVTHYGATKEEVTLQGKVVKNSMKKDDKHFAWVASSRNPELEVEMLRRLNLYLNQRGNQNVTTANGGQSNAIQFSQLADGTPALVINTDFNKAWALLGIAIDRAGYALDGQNRQNGTYSFAKITDKKVGFIIKKIDRDIQNYTIGLADQGDKQIAVVRSHNKGAVSIDEAKAILQKISQEIHF